MRARTSLFAVVPLLVLAACSTRNDTPATTDTAPPTAAAMPADAGAVRQFIESANARAADALKRGDATAVASNYADDAIVMEPGQEAFRGQNAWRSRVVSMLSQMSVKDAAFKTGDVMVAGDLAVETGTYEFTLQPARGREMKDKEHYITVWQRQPDGSWKVVRDITNSGPPAKT